MHMIMDMSNFPELIVINSDDEELEPGEEIEPKGDEGDQAFVKQPEQEPQEEGFEEEPHEEGFEEEPQEEVQEPGTEESVASEGNDVFDSDYDPSRNH